MTIWIDAQLSPALAVEASDGEIFEAVAEVKD